MPRQSITLANQNDEWLKQQVANQEFTSKSEALNYLIKQARNRQDYDNYILTKIDRGLQSGIAEKQTREEMLVEFKNRLRNV